MAPSNRAAYIKAKQDPVMVVDEAPYFSPTDDEIVVKTKAVAINPADYKIQQTGILLENYPAILGCDIAGEVVEAPPSSKFSVGDRITSQTGPLYLKDGTYAYSAFQEYVLLKLPAVAKIPPSLGFDDAVVLPLALATAASCLFPAGILGLQKPWEVDGTRNGKTLLVWGASSSVGSVGVQLATKAGYDVVGIASKRNHNLAMECGAKACFDQSGPNAIDTIAEYLRDKEVIGALDAISTDTTLATVCEVLHKSGARKVVGAVQPGAETKATHDVRITANFAQFTTFQEEIASPLWAWVEQALGDGSLQCLPPKEICGKGLESVQEACDLLAKGVSAKKVVVVF